MNKKNSQFFIDTLSIDIKTKLFHKNIGYVHSVFDEVINIKVDDEIFSITGTSISDTPISLKLKKKLYTKHILRRNMVIIDRDFIRIKDISFSLGKAVTWDSKIYGHIKAIDYETIPILLNVIDLYKKSTMGMGDIIDIYRKPSRLINMRNGTARETYNIIQETKGLMRKYEVKKAAVSLSNLIGLGEGLTPSGDDFLIGVLSILIQPCFLKGNKEYLFTTFVDNMKDEIYKKLSKTTDISAQYLKYAIRGRFSKTIHRLIKAIGYRNKEEIYKYASRLSGMGSTSGCDTLVGMFFGIGLGELNF